MTRARIKASGSGSHLAGLVVRVMLSGLVNRVASRCPVAAARCFASPVAGGFGFTELFQAAHPKETPWRKLTGDGVSTVDVLGKRILQVYKLVRLRSVPSSACLRRLSRRRCASSRRKP